MEAAGPPGGEGTMGRCWGMVAAIFWAGVVWAAAAAATANRNVAASFLNRGTVSSVVASPSRIPRAGSLGIRRESPLSLTWQQMRVSLIWVRSGIFGGFVMKRAEEFVQSFGGE